MTPRMTRRPGTGRLAGLALAVTSALLAARCINGSPVTPTQAQPPTPPAPTVTAVVVTGGGGTANPGQTAQFTASASLSDGTTETVTQQATWESGNPGVAAVSPGGMVSYAAVGDADIRATYRSVTGTTRVTVTAAPVPRFPLSGLVTDAATRRQVANARVEVVDGQDAGRSATTGGDGVYAIADLIEGTIRIRVTHPDYETVQQPAAVSGPTRVDVALPPRVRISDFYGTYGVGLQVVQQTCESPVAPASSGQLSFDGNSDGTDVTIRLFERGATRTYRGTIRADGSFGGGGAGVISLLPPGGINGLINTHDFTGSIRGRITGNSVSGVETVNFGAPCPGRLLEISFSGSR